MLRQFATLECLEIPNPILCSIRVRYADVPGTFTRIDFLAGSIDCHLVHVQPTRNRRSMETHFTGCHRMLVDLRQALDVHDIQTESYLLSPFCGEFRQAGLLVGTIDEFLDQDAFVARLQRIGRPVEVVRTAYGTVARLNESGVRIPYSGNSPIPTRCG